MKSNTSAAAAWWYVRLEWYERRTKEGLIVYPRGILWRNVYRDEFVPYMHLRGVIWRHPDEQRDATQDKRSATCGSIGVWYSGQRRALKPLGEEKVG